MRAVGSVASSIAAAARRDRALIAAKRGIRLDPTEDLLRALLDVCRALAEADIPYALIGGIAVGIQSGQPRATVDVDIAVMTAIDRERVTEALTAKGLRLTGESTHTLNLVTQHGDPVQVSFDESFDPMIGRAEVVAIADVEVHVVTASDLIVSKERAASDPNRRRSKALRDRADIELLRGDVGDPGEGW